MIPSTSICRPIGDVVMVTMCLITKVAAYVAGLAIVIVWFFSPPSLQLFQKYAVVWSMICGEVTSRLCTSPWSHQKLWGAAYGMESMRTSRFGSGSVSTVT